MQPIAKLAIKFGPAEMVVLILFAVITITAFQKSFIKGILIGFLGLLLGTVGIGTTGSVRGTFSSIYLLDGIPFVPALIGLFAFSEMLTLVDKEYISIKPQKTGNIKMTLKYSLDVFKYPWLLLKSSLPCLPHDLILITLTIKLDNNFSFKLFIFKIFLIKKHANEIISNSTKSCKY